MDKLELITKLTELGYKTEIIDGLPYILNVAYPKADKLIKELGYKGSYGIKAELKHQDGNVDTFVWCSDINRIAEQIKAGGENGKNSL